MDFSFSEDQTMLRDLAREILEKEVTAEQLKEVEQDPDWFDRGLWSQLAEANLLGLVAPEDLGGMGWGSRRCACSCRRSGARWRRFRCFRRWCWRACPSPSSAPTSRSEPGSPRWLPGRRS